MNIILYHRAKKSRGEKWAPNFTTFDKTKMKTNEEKSTPNFGRNIHRRHETKFKFQTEFWTSHGISIAAFLWHLWHPLKINLGHLFAWEIVSVLEVSLLSVPIIAPGCSYFGVTSRLTWWWGGQRGNRRNCYVIPSKAGAALLSFPH